MTILDEQEYRNHPSLNFSSAKNLLKSPKHYQASLKVKFEPSREMIMGTVIHEVILEGKSGSYIVRPDDVDYRTKEGKAWRDANAGKLILTSEEDANVKGAVAAVNACADAQYLLGLCKQREVGLVHDYKGVQIKGRIDAYGQDEAGKPLMLDFKTTSDANPQTWGRKAFDLKYPCQTAWYQSLLSLELGIEEAPNYFWLVVETQAPYDVVLYQPPEEALEIGRAQMDHCVETYKKCLETGKWEGYARGILHLDIPAWEKRRWIK